MVAEALLGGMKLDAMMTDGMVNKRPTILIVDHGDTLQSARINHPDCRMAAISLLVLADDWIGQASLEGHEFACIQARQRVKTALKMLGAIMEMENEPS